MAIRKFLAQRAKTCGANAAKAPAMCRAGPFLPPAQAA
jgi:hypothetical protein